MGTKHTPQCTKTLPAAWSGTLLALARTMPHCPCALHGLAGTHLDPCHAARRALCSARIMRAKHTPRCAVPTVPRGTHALPGTGQAARCALLPGTWESVRCALLPGTGQAARRLAWFVLCCVGATGKARATLTLRLGQVLPKFRGGRYGCEGK